MNETIQSVMQTQLVFALQHVPLQGQLTIKEYLDSLLVTFKKFQNEVEWHLSHQNSYSFSIEYLNVLIYELKICLCILKALLILSFIPMYTMI